MLVLLFVALWFILRGDLLYVFPCVILFSCFSVLLALRLPRLGKRELILVLFVVRFVLVWICRFTLPLGIWEGLRFVIVALPGLFSYLFFSPIVFTLKTVKAVPKPKDLNKVSSYSKTKFNCNVRKRTFVHMRPAKIPTSLQSYLSLLLAHFG